MYRPEVSISSASGSFFINLDERIRTSQPCLVDDPNYFGIRLLGLAWCSLIGDSPVDTDKPNLVINKFINNFIKDPFGLIRDYAELADKLLLSLQRQSGTITIDSLHKEFANTPLFREYNEFFKTHSPSLLKYILSFLTFGKKTPFVRKELEPIAFRKWEQVEERISQIRLPTLIINLKRLCHIIFKDFEAGPFLPAHGSGAVAERGILGSSMKNQNIIMDPSIDYIFNKSILQSYDIPLPFRHITRRTADQPSRLKFVMKNYKTYRSICMEPIVHQWAQQGVRLWLENFISDHPMLNLHITLKDQGNNQRYARIGSLVPLVDTIDLASASDSVLWDLIKFIFPGHVLKYLMATRTSRVIVPDGSVRSITKYAPMGSGLCFPIQSILYSLLCTLESLAWSAGKRSDDLSLTLGKPQWAPGVGKYDQLISHMCYGDDIICDKRITSSVIDSLTSLGFEVNTEKSFVGDSPVRESCGIYAFDGRDVTPLQYKIKTVRRDLNADSLTSAISLANRAYEYGFLNLRKTLIHYVLFSDMIISKRRVRKREGMNPILFSSDRNDSLSIYTLNPKNSHLKVKEYEPTKPILWPGITPDYQRKTIFALGVRPHEVYNRDRENDDYYYTSWMRARYGSTGISDITDSRVDIYTLRTGVRLVEVPA